MTAYATAADYAEYKGLPRDHYDADATETARINAGLLNAQDDIDSVIYFARYDLDDETTATALTRATCARFDYFESTGDTGDGAMQMFDSAGIGSVRLAQAGDSSGGQSRTEQLVGPRAARILANAGLLSGVVYES